MKKFLKVSFIVLTMVLIASVASAGTFVNGGFEDGNWNGWTTGGGYWYGGSVSPTDYLPGGSRYNASVFSAKSEVVTQGIDPRSGLNTVYNGTYAARINNYDPSYHVSAISQTVTNYTDSHIYFAWAAVLQQSHSIGDSDYFALKLTDDTKGDTLYYVSYDSASTPAYFHKSGSWYYSDWQVQDLDVSNRIGDTFTLTLLGSDCPYGAHGGYVYLDGFGGTIPQPTVPLPASVVFLAPGLLGLFGLRKKFSA
ncbi:MAG: VPLPA-CTERM sorting domain-containing protein [Smithella sp.]